MSSFYDTQVFAQINRFVNYLLLRLSVISWLFHNVG